MIAVKLIIDGKVNSNSRSPKIRKKALERGYLQVQMFKNSILQILLFLTITKNKMVKYLEHH
jgi:hypothetical protein